MDKKNTMLLTVIAVATLLVAVVGATFAYFSLTTETKDYSKTTVTGTTSKIPSITLTNENKNLYLKVNATEMAQTSINKKFYAVTSDEQRNVTSETSYNILTITTTDGETNTKYKCGGTVKVTVSGTMTDADIQPGDVSIVLTNLDGQDGTTLMDLAGLKETKKTQSNELNADQNYLADKNLTVEIEAENIACPIQQ